MKTNKLLAISSIALALAVPAFAQLQLASVPTSNPALTMQSDPLLLSYLTSDTTEFTTAGITFTNVSNYSLGDIVIGSGDLGTFNAQVSYLGRESVDTNWFGVQDGFGTSTALYAPYNEASEPISYSLTSDTYTTIDFWHSDLVAPYTGTFWMDDDQSFRTWEAIDVANNMIYTIFGIDDRRVSFVDFDDGAFLVSRNLNPVGLEPVPEPSTYGLMGAGALLALALYRRRKAKTQPVAAAAA